MAYDMRISDWRSDVCSSDLAGRRDRLGLPGPALRRDLCAGRGPAAAADAPGGGTLHPEAHAQPVRRGAVRALGREPVLPALLRRGRVPPRAAVRPLVADPLAPAPGGGTLGGTLAGGPVRGAPDRRPGDQGPGAGGGGHHGAAEGYRPPDRRQADAPGDRKSTRLTPVT